MASVLTVAGWVRHANGWSGALDLGIFDQGIWLLSEGLAPEVTVNGRNLFADHLSPVLLAFVPLYVVAPSVMWLIAGQAVGIAVGVPAVRALARSFDVETPTVTMAYLLSGPLLAAAAFDFHPSTMAVGPLLWVLASLRAERRSHLVAAVLAVLACRADLGWTVAAMALIAPRQYRRTLIGLGLGGAALGYVVPSMLGAEATFPVHYGHLGSSPGDVLLHPWRLMMGFTGRDVQTTALWFMSTGLLTLLARRWAAAAIISALPVLLSSWPGTEERFFHYGAPVVPLILTGAIAGSTTLGRVRARTVLLLGATASAAFCSPLLASAPRPHRLWAFVHPRFDNELSEALAAVGPDEAVTATDPLVPHLSHRRLVFGYPLPFRPVENETLYGRADGSISGEIRVVIVERHDVDAVEALGFDVEVIGDLAVGRR